MKTSDLIAFDRATSLRRYDDDGRLHVEISNISKAAVNPYYGAEIPGFANLGLDPAKIYYLLRDPAELEAAAPTFSNVPLQIKHIHQKANSPQKDSIIGSIGDLVYNAPYLQASLCVWDEQAIALIESQKMVELSSAYHYVAVMEPGEYESTHYDGRMTNIRGNHVALVEDGRAGSDVVVSDANPFTTKQDAPAMKPTKLGLALKLALSAASPKIAQDSSLVALVGQAKAKTFKKADVLPKLLAMDSEIDTGQLDAIIDAIIGVEDNPEPEKPPEITAGDNEADSGHAGIMSFLSDKGLSPDDLETVGGMLSKIGGPAADEEPDDVMSKEDVTTAMDAMRADLKKQFLDLETAKSAVRGTVGDVIGMDSAAAVYKFALDHLKVDRKDMPDAGLASLYKVAAERKATPAPFNAIANDAAIASAIPGLDRIK